MINPATQLLEEIDGFAAETFIEGQVPIACFSKFHLSRKEKPHYYDVILRALDYAGQTEYMEVINFVAYLEAIDPDSHKTLKQAKESLLEKGIDYLRRSFDEEQGQRIQSQFSKLISPQKYCQIVQMICRLDDNVTSSPRDILKLLLLLQRKIDWEIQKRRHFLTNNQRQTLGIMHQVLANLRELSYLQNPNVIQGKMSLLLKILNFLIEDMEGRKLKQAHLTEKIQSLKQNIVSQVEICMQSLTLNSTLKFQLIEACVKLFSIYDQHSLKSIISKSINKFNLTNRSFLNLITTVLRHSSEKKVITKQIAMRLLQDLTEKTVNVKQGSISEDYSIVSNICDVMIRICRQEVLDMTKTIMRHFTMYQIKDCHQLFLAALLLLFDVKMSEKMMESLSEQSKQVFMQNKYQELYNDFLKQFGRNDFSVQQFGFDPQKCDEMIPWKLQTLRLSIVLNYEWLHQVHLLSGIVSNLIKFIVHNILQRQATEIVLFAIAEAERNKDLRIHTPDYDKYWLSKVDILSIINDILNSYNLSWVKLPSNQSLECLFDILKALRSSKQLQGLDTLELFVKVTHLVGLILTLQGRSDHVFLELAFQLLRTSLPLLGNQIKDNNLSTCLNMLQYLIQSNISDYFSEIFMELVYICLEQSPMRNMIVQHCIFSSIRNQELKILKFPQKQHLQILCLMLDENAFGGEELISRCKSLFHEALSLSFSEICLFLAKIISSFLHKVTETSPKKEGSATYRLFLMQQIRDTVHYCQQISNRIKKTAFIQEIIKLFEVLQVFHAYLLELIVVSQQANPKSSLNDFQLVQKYCNGHVVAFFQQKWLYVIRQNQHQKSLKKAIVTNYYLQLMLMELSGTGHLSRNGSLSRQNKIVKKFGWLENMMDKELLVQVKLARDMKRILMNQLLPDLRAFATAGSNRYYQRLDIS